MENASKALLIAGSILIAILLIAFGMKVFKQTEGTTYSLEESMQATEIATFNSKFTQYLGANKSRAQIISLANLIIANNSSNSEHKVKMAFRVGDNEGELEANEYNKMIVYASDLEEGKYNCQPFYNNTGYLVSIQIY